MIEDRNEKGDTKEVADWLGSVRNEMKNLATKTDIQPLLSDIELKVTLHHLGCILALHHTGLFQELLQTSVKHSQKGPSQLPSRLETLYHFGYDAFFRRYQYYVQIFEELRERNGWGECNPKKYMGNDRKYKESFENAKKILDNLFILKETKM
jgi:hypothetical protein